MTLPQAQIYICDLQTYQPGLPIEQAAREHGLQPGQIIKLASNENPQGPSPWALAALKNALATIHRYPEQYDLIQVLAAHCQVSSAQIVLGNGSNDILDLIAHVYLGQGSEAICARYAFAIYALATKAAGAQVVTVADKQYGHDLAGMRKAITPRTKVIWLANPNNPTGTFVPYKAIQQFMDTVPDDVIVVLDEAYYEYLSADDQEDAIKWINAYPNLVVVRTFSKIYGLAGLRIGYAIASSPVAELLNRPRQPFNANNLAITAAIAALGDQAFVQQSRTANDQGRRQLLEGLHYAGLRCLPAYGNFVTVQVPQARSVSQFLLGQGIIVRPLANYSLDDWLRITIGRPEENARLLEALASCITHRGVNETVNGGLVPATAHDMPAWVH